MKKHPPHAWVILVLSVAVVGTIWTLLLTVWR